MSVSCLLESSEAEEVESLKGQLVKQEKKQECGVPETKEGVAHSEVLIILWVDKDWKVSEVVGDLARISFSWSSHISPSTNCIGLQ